MIAALCCHLLNLILENHWSIESDGLKLLIKKTDVFYALLYLITCKDMFDKCL